nr:MAG TPA: hypothetical protein [Bacteriophage sp.]
MLLMIMALIACILRHYECLFVCVSAIVCLLLEGCNVICVWMIK